MIDTQTKPKSNSAQTLTPQNAFPLCGSLEDEKAVAQIGNLLLTEENGLFDCCTNDVERWLCRHYQQRLGDYPKTSREQWSRLKEFCLLSHGSSIAAAIDTMASAHRTPAIAEAAIRSTGDRFYDAAFAAGGDKMKDKARTLFQSIMKGAVPAPTEEELAT